MFSLTALPQVILAGRKADEYGINSSMHVYTRYRGRQSFLFCHFRVDREGYHTAWKEHSILVRSKYVEMLSSEIAYDYFYYGTLQCDFE